MVGALDNSKTRTYTVTINIEEIVDGGFIKLNNSGVTKTVSAYKGEHSDVTKIMNKNRQDKSTDANLATGDIILKGSTEYRIVILSDINGDGKTSSVDYVRIWNHLDRSNTNKIKDELQLIAADVNQDNKVSAVDYVRIWNMLKRN
jgi:hypothetical protein